MINKVNQRDLEILTEWCRNKPEDAAIQILYGRHKNKEINYVICDSNKTLREVYAADIASDFPDMIGFNEYVIESTSIIRKYFTLTQIIGLDLGKDSKITIHGDFTASDLKRILSRMR